MCVCVYVCVCVSYLVIALAGGSVAHSVSTDLQSREPAHTVYCCLNCAALYTVRKWSEEHAWQRAWESAGLCVLLYAPPWRSQSDA